MTNPAVNAGRKGTVAAAITATTTSASRPVPGFIGPGLYRRRQPPSNQAVHLPTGLEGRSRGPGRWPAPAVREERGRRPAPLFDGIELWLEVPAGDEAIAAWSLEIRERQTGVLDLEEIRVWYPGRGLDEVVESKRDLAI